MIYTEQDISYTITDLGFDKSLVKVIENQNLLDSILPEMRNIFTEGIAPKTVISGELLSTLEQQTGVLFSGKTAFSNTDTGYRLGIDVTDNLVKFYIGNSSSYLNWTGTSLVIVGSLTASSGAVGGFDIGSDYIRDLANSMGIASTVTAGDDVRFWAGATFANRATAPFYVTEAGRVQVGSLQRDDFQWTTLFESIDGYTTSGTVTVSNTGASLVTGVNIGDDCLLQKSLGNQSGPVTLSWDKKRRFKTRVTLDNNSQDGYVVMGQATTSSAVPRHVGFKISGNRIRGTVADGTTQSTTTANSLVGGIGSSFTLVADHFPGDRVDFYIDGSLIESLSSNIPSGNTLATNFLYVFWETTTTAAQTLIIPYWDFWQED